MLAVGPMSSETIEAVYKYSHTNKQPLMLIASKNQIDYSGGYVNNWTTKEYMQHVSMYRGIYPESQVKICRDHCGPGFNGSYDLSDVYQTIQSDIENGFDLIHIDFCHFRGSKKEIIKETIYAIQYAQKLKPDIELEIGTDEIGQISNLNNIKKEIEIFLEYCRPVYYVVNTGSLIKEDRQVGCFNSDIAAKACQLLKKYDVQLKEHNADYLGQEEILRRKNCISAMNIAPQMGVVQTKKILSCAEAHGIPAGEFLDASYASNKWTKWIYDSNPADKLHLGMVAGHYNYMSYEYAKLYNALGEFTDIHDLIIESLMEVIDLYVSTFS
jgi:hypothetical protein